MGSRYQKDSPPEREGYTAVNGLAIAALITRAMPEAQRTKVMAHIAARSPVTGAALEASIEKIEAQISTFELSKASERRQQIKLPAPEEIKPEVVVQPAPKAAAVMPKQRQENTENSELSPAELLLEEREGTHEDLERELQRQRSSGAGRRRIISA
jgi:hypothetical protein